MDDTFKVIFEKAGCGYGEMIVPKVHRLWGEIGIFHKPVLSSGGTISVHRETSREKQGLSH